MHGELIVRSGSGALRTTARRLPLLCALALAFGFIGTVAGITDAVWFQLPGGVAEHNYVSLGRRAALSKRVEGMAATSVAEIVQKVPEANWLTVERLHDVEVDVALDGGAVKHRLLAEGVSGSLFDTLGVAAASGKLSADRDAAAAVLGYAAWQRLFAGLDIVGATLTLPGDGALVLVGIAPRGFSGLLGEQAELWILNPHRLPSNVAKDDFSKRIDAAIPNKHVFGVLDESMSLTKLNALLANMSFVTDPDSAGALGVTAEDRLEITPGIVAHPDMRHELLWRMQWLVVIVVCVFVLAFATLAESFVAKQDTRAEDHLVRVAVGATPLQLYRRCLAENAGLISAMALLAVAAGAYIGDVLLSIQPFAATVAALAWQSIALGYAVGTGTVLFAYALAAVYALRFVALASRSTSRARRSHRSLAARRLLLFAATASLLLVSSVAERYWREARIAFGFTGKQALLVQMWSDDGGAMVAPPATVVRDTIGTLPQVRAAARMDLLPFVQPLSRANSAQIMGNDRLDDVAVLFSGVEPAYFRALGVPLLAGRFHDTAAEVVVSRALAMHLVDAGAAPSQVLGRAVHIQRDDHAQGDRVATVVGVVENIAYGHYLDGERTVVYGSSEGASWDQRWAIDHDGDAATLLEALRQADALQGFEVLEIGTPENLFRTQFMARRSVEILLAGVALLALTLALAGLAASVTRHLAEDRHAIGVGVAIGATSWSLAWRYLDAVLLDFMVAAALPSGVLVALCVVFPTAMASVSSTLSISLIVPVLAVTATFAVSIVCLATRHQIRMRPPASLLRSAEIS